ncbi:MAG: aldo/keto reductase [Phycisphaerales bacterium]|jgi:aryl-alcohol dehydrogenase-like predicted oxidoreductase
MTENRPEQNAEPDSTRRQFLKKVGFGAVAGGMAGLLPEGARSQTSARKVKHRVLGKTGLRVSEIGIGGHSWAYEEVPDGKGGHRRPTVDEAVRMIGAAIDKGVNFLDSCTAPEESSTPGEALKRLGARDKVLVSIRVSHKMKGIEADKQEIYKWTEDRLRLWQTDYVDFCLLCNTEKDTPQSGYWDMSYSIEALDKLKQQGKIRFTGFGCHFTPELFLEAFDKFGDYFDTCSMPYNIRHRAAEKVLPAARKKGLGVITIKPLARGDLLKDRDLRGAYAGLPRDMIAFVLENKLVDICTCGVHTIEQTTENLSASWTKLSPAGRKRLKEIAGTHISDREHAWLERDWRYA